MLPNICDDWWHDYRGMWVHHRCFHCCWLTWGRKSQFSPKYWREQIGFLDAALELITVSYIFGLDRLHWLDFIYKAKLKLLQPYLWILFVFCDFIWDLLVTVLKTEFGKLLFKSAAPFGCLEWKLSLGKFKKIIAAIELESESIVVSYSISGPFNQNVIFLTVTEVEWMCDCVL